MGVLLAVMAGLSVAIGLGAYSFGWWLCDRFHRRMREATAQRDQDEPEDPAASFFSPYPPPSFGQIAGAWTGGYNQFDMPVPYPVGHPLGLVWVDGALTRRRELGVIIPAFGGHA